MKITDVECLVLDRQFPFVRIYTDEGIVGIGECFRRLPRVIKAITDGSLKSALVGKDPLDTELRWRDMYNAGSGFRYGRSGLLRHGRTGHRSVGHQGQGFGDAHTQTAGRQIAGLNKNVRQLIAA